jgi:hypothetical protein
MLQTMVSVLDGERTVHVQVHDGLVDIALAALSAEPATVDELLAAMGRFVEPGVIELIRDGLQEGLARDTLEGGHLIIDLSAKLAVNGTTTPEMPRLGNVLTCDEHASLEEWLPYRIPDDWQMVRERDHWEALADKRRRKLAAGRTWDAREVLYGRLAENLVHRWLAVAAETNDPIVAIQDWWLLTPREDLRGHTPRQILLARREFIDGDVDDQGQTWTLTGKCPPGLSQRSAAYRYGGFGSQEIILYHELVATLLKHCAERLGDRREVDEHAEICHLEQVQQEWLHQPEEELYDQSPAALIARERSRLPFVVPKSHAVLHDDCPLCRMMAESDAPMIWQLDNFPLEDRFATSLHPTREEWEDARGEWGDAMGAGRPAAGDAVPVDNPDDSPPRVWQSSYTNMSSFAEMPPIEACSVMLFSIGGHLAELVQDLRQGDDSDALVRQLHLRFDELRVLVREREDVWMLNTSVSEFSDALREVATVREDLGEKCADLDEKLDFLAHRYSEHFDQDQEAAY